MSGIVESVRGVLWARKRTPEQVAYLVSLAPACVMNCSGADPHGLLRVYGASVLPSLRDS